MSPSTQSQLLEQSLSLLQEAEAEIVRLKSARPEPAAIIGMGCRLPGGVVSAATYWELLLQQRHGISALDPGRFLLDETTGGALRAGFVHDFDSFDHRFFGITQREARTLDPQQRLFLHVALEALHDAGLARERLARGNVGVYVGANNTEYLHELLKRPELVDEHTVVGNALSIIANRLSYFLDLRGASMVVDTACSSSLVAVHLALGALRRREIDLAIVGGVSLICSPDNARSHLAGLPISKDARCFSFDARANGYVRGEGCGVVVLKRQGDASEAGDRAYAVICGSAVNQDARTNGITAPSGLAQQEVIRTALSDAQVDPDVVRLIEAHGTGTELGDPIEFEALAQVYGKKAPTALGAVKSSIGHLEAASGVAGLIKVALCMSERTIAPNYDYRSPNPHLVMVDGRLFVPTRAAPLPEGAYAAISSFGAGGTNAHLVLGEAGPRSHERPAGEPDARGHLVSLSATSRSRLDALAASLVSDLERRPLREGDLSALSFSSFHRHSELAHRLVCFARSGDELRGHLGAFLAGEDDPLVTCGEAVEGDGRRVWFVFPGQGSQWSGMARELVRSESVFAEAIAECGAALREYLDLAACFDREEAYEDIGLVQPMLFSMQVALARLWEHRGVTPDGVVGHSMGEVAAAVVAGKLSLADGARVIGFRSRLMRGLRGRGGMLFVAASHEDVASLLRDEQVDASIAVINAPDACVVAGAGGAIEALAARFARDNLFHRPVKVDVASHCSQVDPILEGLRVGLAALAPRASRTPMLSTCRGEGVEGPELSADYWAENLRAPVQFGPTLEGAMNEDDVFIEMSPHPILLESVQRIAEARSKAVLTIASMHRGVDPRGRFLVALAAAAAAGASVDRTALCPAGGAFVRPVGSVPWEVQRFWPFTELAPSKAAPAPRSSPRLTAVAGSVPDTLAIPPAHAIKLVTSKVAEIVEEDERSLDGRLGFFQMGMTSLMLTRLAAALARETGLPLRSLDIVRNATIDSLAQLLVTRSQARAHESLTPRDDRPPPSLRLAAVASTRAAPPVPRHDESVLSELDSLLKSL